MSNVKKIRTVLVIGSGAMGSQIAMVCANAGLTVTCTDLDQSALDRAESMLRARMDSKVAKGRMTAEQRDAAFERLTLTTDRDSAARTADLVIEAAVEKLVVKRSLFAELADLAPESAILASNSSSFVPSSMASAVTHPGRFCNIHFFNPALVMKCVEVVRGPETTDDTMVAATAFVEEIGKIPVVLEKEIPGFVANRILGAVRDEALHLLEGGYADVEAIDTACRTALGYPMGPFELMDLTGIDIGYLVKKQRFAESGDPKDQPADTVTRLVERGDLGRKTGRGWYIYSDSGEKQGINQL